MAALAEMLDYLDGALAEAKAKGLRSGADCLTLVAPKTMVLECRGRPVEMRADDFVLVFTVKQTRSMRRTLARTLAAEAGS